MVGLDSDGIILLPAKMEMMIGNIMMPHIIDVFRIGKGRVKVSVVHYGKKLRDTLYIYVTRH